MHGDEIKGTRTRGGGGAVKEVKYGEVTSLCLLSVAKANCSNSTSQALPNSVAQTVRWTSERIQIEAWSMRKQSNSRANIR